MAHEPEINDNDPLDPSTQAGAERMAEKIRLAQPNREVWIQQEGFDKRMRTAYWVVRSRPKANTSGGVRVPASKPNRMPPPLAAEPKPVSAPGCIRARHRGYTNFEAESTFMATLNPASQVIQAPLPIAKPAAVAKTSEPK